MRTERENATSRTCCQAEMPRESGETRGEQPCTPRLSGLRQLGAELEQFATLLRGNPFRRFAKRCRDVELDHLCHNSSPHSPQRRCHDAAVRFFAARFFTPATQWQKSEPH